MSIFLGIDAGTQSIKAELIDTETGNIICSEQVHFGRELPEYASPDGYKPAADPALCCADPLMWVDAMELLFGKLREQNAHLDRVAGISGSGQQHGSVYLREHITPLRSGIPAREQIRPKLSRPAAPIWMDATTGRQCAELDERFGSRMQQISGSPAIERFTGPQIRKFFQETPEAYAETKVIHLVSSFLCSLLTGKDAPIDYGDGAGMNLLNLQTLEWDGDFTGFTAPGLMSKLPLCTESSRIAGGLSEYFTRYGFRAGIPVTVFSGDNPNSLAGMGATTPGTAVISLGTSDTFFSALENFSTDPDGFGHVFGNPAGGFMSMSCFANGSLAREKIRAAAGADWDFFDNTACTLTPPGNNGKFMLPYFGPETTPCRSAGVKYNFDTASASPAEMIRSIMESQALSMYKHTRWVPGNFSTVKVTGGASRSRSFRQILADVFQAEIVSIEVVNSAALGAALRAANAVEAVPFAELYQAFCRPAETLHPNRGNREIYSKSLQIFTDLENS